MWFTEEVSGNIGRSTLDGVITEFPTVTPTGPFDTALRAIVRGPDDNPWFTTGEHNRVGRITVAGEAVLFPLPSPGFPEDIARGPR
jgi:virginiamycin B lyase